MVLVIESIVWKLPAAGLLRGGSHFRTRMRHVNFQTVFGSDPGRKTV